MKPFHLATALATWVLLPAALFAAEELPLWPNGLPEGATVFDQQQIEEARSRTTDERIAFVDQPSLTLYPAPEDRANGCAVVICPGGGYNILAWPKEGVEVAEWLNELGVTAAILKYRVPRRNPEAPHREPLQDLQRGVRLVRSKAAQWKVDPARVGVLGFSAGGHLTVVAATHWDQPAYAAQDEADRLSCRPDFIIPIYAAYLGENEEQSVLNENLRITAKTPPAFMAVTYDDKFRAAHAAMLFVRMKEAGVPAELHIYSRGGHGYGLRPSQDPVSNWPKLCGDWLRVSGFLGPDRGSP